MTTPDIKKFQQVFAENLFSDKILPSANEDLLDHIVPMFGDSDQKLEAVERLKIYRNNVILSLRDAVGDTFPVVKRLIGDDCFNAAAVSFVRQNPPEHPSLLFYGETFIEFIATYPACVELTFLSDVALLEWNYIRAFHAENVTLLENSTLDNIAPESLGNVVFSLHPSVNFMQSQWPVDDIWEENLKEEVATIELDTDAQCNLLIYRKDYQVEVINLAYECFNLLTALSQGKTIVEAWEYAVELQLKAELEPLAETELSNMLGYLLSLSIFTSARVNDPL